MVYTYIPKPSHYVLLVLESTKIDLANNKEFKITCITTQWQHFQQNVDKIIYDSFAYTNRNDMITMHNLQIH
jgi:hypothetical protein